MALKLCVTWLYRYGFNPGSQLVLVGLQNSFAVSNCAVTTTLAPAAAGMSALLCKALLSHRSTGELLPWAAACPKGKVSDMTVASAACLCLFVRLDGCCRQLDHLCLMCWLLVWGHDSSMPGSSMSTTAPTTLQGYARR
jgi:hypothetical protein